MIYEVVLSEQADANLHNIFEYIACELRTVQTAADMLDQLEEKITKLNHMPERFKLYDREPWRSRGLRQLLVGSFCVFYIPNEQKKTVTIIRVIYGGRDMYKELKKRTKYEFD